MAEDIVTARTAMKPLRDAAIRIRNAAEGLDRACALGDPDAAIEDAQDILQAITGLSRAYRTWLAGHTGRPAHVPAARDPGSDDAWRASL